MPPNEPRHVMRNLKPTIGNPDHSIPDREDHQQHIMHIARANRGRGFPVCVPRKP